MKKGIALFLNSWQYGGLTKTTYQEISGSIRRKNRNTMTVAAGLAVVLAVALLLGSFFLETIAQNRSLYLLLLAVSVSIYAACRLLLTRHEKLILPMVYLFLSLIYLYGIVLGAELQPDIPATTICVLLFALPLLVVDKPWRVSAMLVIAALSFIVWSGLKKSPEVFQLDAVNAASFLFLGVMINYLVLKVKIQEIFNTDYITRELDTDELTKLLNKAAAQRRVQAYIRATRKPAAMLVIDIDNFKNVNDTLGHAYGDAVLRIAGECIRESFDKGTTARFGGDEFVVFLPYEAKKNEVKADIQALRARVRSSFVQSPVPVTCSAGISFYPADACDYDDLFKKADKALYLSKNSGKNRYAF